MRHPLFAFDPAPVTIIGLGSPWGDDRVGWCVADALSERLGPARARILKLDRPGTGLLDRIAGRHRVLLVDAAVTGAAPGSLHVLPLTELASGSSTASSHGFGLADALRLGRNLGMLPPELDIYIVSIDSAQTQQSGRDLTPAVAAAVGPLRDAICLRLAGGDGGRRHAGPPGEWRDPVSIGGIDHDSDRLG
jgi:hydrogenase maturation protease